MAEIAGLDFSWTKPDPASVASLGYKFVIGYISNTAGKNLSAPYAQECRAVGLQVGLVWEEGANRVLTGTSGGSQDGQTADQQLNALGYPVDAVVLVAVDYQAPATDFPLIADYLTAFDANTKRPVGVYGDYSVVEHFVTPGQRPVRYGWQTVAWSNGLLSAKASLYQRNVHHWPLPPGTGPQDTDEDVLCIPGLPLWGATAPAPTPTPPADWTSIPDMQYGEVGPPVLHLQQFMVRVFPAYNTYTPNGIYGPATTAGLAEFQRRSGIVGGDGRNVGPQTKQALWQAGYRP